MATTARARKVESGPRGRCLKTLVLRNRQRHHRLDMRLLRQIAQALLGRACPNNSFDLAIYIVSQERITHLNEAFLRHKGPADVIAFDYSATVAADVSRRIIPAVKTAPTKVGGNLLHGEIFVCLDEAKAQARRFHTTWQSELVRYVVHGLLHLLGYDDQAPRARREMKKAEDALLSELARQFHFRRLSPA